MDIKPATDLRKAYKTTVIIGLAMMASLLVYTIIVESIKKQYDPFEGFSPMPEMITTLRYVFFGLTAVDFFLIQFFNKLMLSGKIPVQKTLLTGRFSTEMQRLVTGSILTFALCESVAIYGLVLFLIQGNSTDFYLFLLISFFYFTVFFPKYGAWEAWLKEREKDVGLK